ncbi:MAG TPA: Rho termination factor N-terminal domain-containing protein [Bacilli bacterium]|nr:Rho termination factor N-terminal domain-containing protein [Bacilli bacterium]
MCEANGLEVIDYVTEDDKKGKKEKNEKKVEDKKIVETVVEETKEEKADLFSKTLAELKAMAKESGIKGYSTMKKEDLIKALN